MRSALLLSGPIVMSCRSTAEPPPLTLPEAVASSTSIDVHADKAESDVQAANARSTAGPKPALPDRQLPRKWLFGEVDVEYGKIRVESPRFSLSSGWDDGETGFDLDARAQVQCNGRALLLARENCVLFVIPPGEWSYQPYLVVELRHVDGAWLVEDLGVWLQTDIERFLPDGSIKSRWTEDLTGRIRLDADPKDLDGAIQCSFSMQFDGRTRIRGRFSAVASPPKDPLPRVVKYFLDGTG